MKIVVGQYIFISVLIPHGSPYLTLLGNKLDKACIPNIDPDVIHNDGFFLSRSSVGQCQRLKVSIANT